MHFLWLWTLDDEYRCEFVPGGFLALFAVFRVPLPFFYCFLEIGPFLIRGLLAIPGTVCFDGILCAVFGSGLGGSLP